MNELKKNLDHPVVFLLLITIGVMCGIAVIKWGAKATHNHGLSALAGA